MPPSDPKTALARQQSAVAVGRGGALLPNQAVQSAVPVLLKASVDAFGDVVAALVTDLHQTESDMTDLSWLATTHSLLEGEAAYKAAQQQLVAWEEFLGKLPNPQLLSEARRDEIRQARGLRHRTIVAAREAAMAEHQRLVDEEMMAPDLTEADYHRLQKVRQDPRPADWRVDLEATVAAALAVLPPMPSIVPICAEDLSAQYNFSVFNAVATMREHPQLGPRAAGMDAALASALRAEFKLNKAEALQHGQALTSIFYVALRRALAQGSNQMAASLHIVSRDQGSPVQTQFTRELFESWVVYLSTLPVNPPRLSLGERVPMLGRLMGKGEGQAALPVADAPKQIGVNQVEGEQEQEGAWARLKRSLKKG